MKLLNLMYIVYLFFAWKAQNNPTATMPFAFGDRTDDQSLSHLSTEIEQLHGTHCGIVS